MKKFTYLALILGATVAGLSAAPALAVKSPVTKPPVVTSGDGRMSTAVFDKLQVVTRDLVKLGATLPTDTPQELMKRQAKLQRTLEDFGTFVAAVEDIPKPPMVGSVAPVVKSAPAATVTPPVVASPAADAKVEADKAKVTADAKVKADKAKAVVKLGAMPPLAGPKAPELVAPAGPNPPVVMAVGMPPLAGSASAVADAKVKAAKAKANAKAKVAADAKVKADKAKAVVKLGAMPPLAGAPAAPKPAPKALKAPKGPVKPKSLTAPKASKAPKAPKPAPQAPMPKI
jgi:hypothetical protein